MSQFRNDFAHFSTFLRRNLCANAFFYSPNDSKDTLNLCIFLYAYMQKNAIQGYIFCYIYEKTPDATDTILSFYARPLKIQDVFRLVQ